MAVTLDVGACDNIHPKDKETVADRLAYWALVKTYHVGGIEFSGPIYKAMKITDDGKVQLSFDYTAKWLTSFGQELSGFEIAGKDKIFYPAEAKINLNKTVTVWNQDVKEPVSVRYAFKSCTNATLYNNAGLPASSFRTDDWDE